jgi:DNA modification methylase
MDGNVAGLNPPSERVALMPNTLYYGDNLDLLRRKLRDETIDLCYIDPPFNSKRNYFQIYNNIGQDDQAQAQAFIDTWTWNELAMAGFQEIITNSPGCYTRQTMELMKGLKAVLGDNGLLAYLISITQRVNEIQRVLKPTGSFYLHCDPTASHYLKLVLDGIFCGRGGDFRNEVIWHYRKWSIKQQQFVRNHDTIFFYSKSDSKKRAFNQLFMERTESTKKRFGKAKIISGHDASGKRVPSKTDEAESEGVPLDDVWDIGRVPPIKQLFPTQKPEALLERILQASSHEGDTVLDAYCGCGTTAAVAQRLRRNWIGIDITYQSIAVILKRLEDSFGAAALESLVLDGIPRDMESARALANKKDDRVRKEFEKWALLTYSKNRATLNEKKGADKGVDGTAYFVTGSDTTERVIFQVKSGTVKRSDIATLRGDMGRENAELAVFITLEESTKPMRNEAMAAGVYHHALLNRDYPRIQIVTVREMIEETRRIDLPLSLEVLKSAATATTEEQQALLLN